MMTVQLKRKKKTISKQLQEALDSIPSPDFEKLQPKVDRVFAIGRQEGLSDKEIGKLVRGKMKGHYGSATIWRVFEDYPEARQKQNHKKVFKMKTFDEGICSKCGKPYKDPEEEVWQFNAQEFKIQTVPKAPRQYLETATEHFYAESRKWKKKYEEALAKPKSKPKKIQGTMQDKTDLLSKAFAARREGTI